ncbi:dihydrolipoyl dehydrogenase family protein [Cellulomonas shaoxiangyii]|uniref:dihydrolipoyl dehydrogenase family protein n=1 Tax=Cellulomonas shaoxiangyii TaxID=2566013 RepID=UPI001FB65AB8|nr:NAD(P)/FAD-dependent oxidoreductase [Cellulomonas shaoxiangyii]
MSNEVQEFDVVVLGAGAVGENAADRASRTGLSVALVESQLVGGECSYWACMPSKALLRAGDALAAARDVPGAAAAVTGGVDVAAVLARRDEVTSHWDDAGQVRWVEGAGLTLLRGHARLTGARELVLTHEDTDTRVLARHAVVVATGSVAAVPRAGGLADVRPWTSREATSAHTVPPRLAVVGGGVVGVEMATAFADLGSEVTLLVRGDRLLPRAEPFAGEALARALVDRGVRVALRASVVAASRDDAGVHLTVEHEPRDASAGTEQLVADEVLVATGRRPATEDLGLETVGLTPGGALEVDDALQVQGVEGGWLFAVGDVTGRTGTTHQGKYDARVVGDVLAARFDPRPGGGVDGPQVPRGLSREGEAGAGPWSRYRATADAAAVPQVVFTRPQVAWVGPTEEEARRAGLDVGVVGYDLGGVAGASVTGEHYEGRVQVVVDRARDVLVGATFVGPDVADMLHAATVAVVGEVPLHRLWHAVPSYPTLSEVWLRLLEADGR